MTGKIATTKINGSAPLQYMKKADAQIQDPFEQDGCCCNGRMCYGFFN